MTNAQLNALVAEKVMGFRFWIERRGGHKLAVYSKGEPWKRQQSQTWEHEKLRYQETDALTAAATGFFGSAPCYCDDIQEAFRVLDHLDPTDCTLEKSGLLWTVTISGWAVASDPDRRRAIVLACLAAKGVEVRP